MNIYLKSFHVIEGMPELRNTLKDLIEYHGYKARAFDSSESYLEYFNSSEFIEPIAIFTGYKVNREAEMKMVKTIKERLPDQKIVLLAGVFDIKLTEDIESYACNLLPLPYGPEDLLAMLKSLFKSDLGHQSKHGENAMPLHNLN